MKRIILTVAIVLAGVSPAWALVDFSQLRCESPEIKQVIVTDLPTMKFEDGSPITRQLSIGAISKLETLKADKNNLVCRMVIKLSSGGNSRTIRGKFKFKQFPDGRISEQWTPGY